MTVETRTAETPIVRTQTQNVWLDAADELAAGRGAAAPDWIRRIRAEGRLRLAEVGLPGPHDEDWRLTNGKPITEGRFRIPSPKAVASGADLDLSPFNFPGLDAPLLVFVDGIFSPGLSHIDRLPIGVTVSPLATAWLASPHLVKPHLGHLAQSGGEPFTALNAALFENGAFIHVTPRVATGVVRVLHVATQFSTEGSERRMTPPMAPSMVHPRSLIVVDESSEITVIEDRVSLGAQPALVNAVTEIVVGANARVHYYNLARENKASLAVASVYASQARDSHFASHTALLGGRLIRSNIYPVLNGEGCTSLLNGFYIPTGSQQHDTNMIVRHAAPHGRSRQFYRGILADQSRAVFSGRIIVEEGAQQTDARQTDMNLLLSNEAVVDTKPQLEIYTDDVKCTHGATVGQLDPDAVFYLKARGIPEEQARGLLVFAFVNEVLDRMELGPVRDGLAAQLRERLAGTEQ